MNTPSATREFSCVITQGAGEAALRASADSVLGQSLRAVEALVVLAADADAALRTAAAVTQRLNGVPFSPLTWRLLCDAQSLP